MKKLQTNSITAIVLAGGQSSRMGQDKAFIKIENQPLLLKICLLAQECSEQVYVITPWIEKYESILPKSCHLIREILLSGQTKPQGPLVAFAQGLAKVETEWTLLLACDLPYLTFSEVKKWTTYLPEIEPEILALLPKNPKGWEPLCGFYHLKCLPFLSEFINDGGRSFQDWLAQHPVQELPITDPKLLFNCNTPKDLESVFLI